MMRKTRPLALGAALIAAVASVMSAGRAYAGAADRKSAAKEKERKLIAVLLSDAPPQNKAIPCKQLAIYGSKAAVPALAALLPDKELASWARIALEAIPGPAAAEALCEAMGKLKGRLLVGVINSIGVRRDAKAADALVARLKDADAAVAAAAAEALGRIGGAGAAKALEQSLAGAPAAARSAVAYGCILCAERLLAGGKGDEAAKLYDAVRKAAVPKQRILEATRGAILARGSAGAALLVEQLKSADKARFWLGLRTARELPGPEATEAMVAELGRLTPHRRAMLILALADRGDAKAMPAVLAAVKSGPKTVRMMAMGALEGMGDASCVPVLLAAALEADAALAQRAKATLARLPGEKVSADILTRLPKASGRVRQVLIELVAQRRIDAAAASLVRYAGDADAQVRGAAVAALGAIGKAAQVADLVGALQKTQDAKEREGIEKALKAIGARAGAGCVRHLMPLTRSGQSALRVIGLRALAAAGGPEALAAVRSAIDDKDEAVQDEAVRTLSTWPNNWPDDAGVSQPLLALAKSSKKMPHRILALRGYLQYVRGAKKLNDGQRLARLKEVVPLVTRREEKRLVVSVLGTIRTGGALDSLATFAADPAVAEEACSAIVNLTGRRGLTNASKAQRRRALQAAVERSKSGRTKRRAAALLKAIK